jgi:hypothetical protein
MVDIYVYTCMYICIYIYTHTHTHMYVCVCVCVCIYIYILCNTCTHTHTHTGGIKVYPSVIPETSDDCFDPESPEVICVAIYTIHRGHACATLHDISLCGVYGYV